MFTTLKEFLEKKEEIYRMIDSLQSAQGGNASRNFADFARDVNGLLSTFDKHFEAIGYVDYKPGFLRDALDSCHELIDEGGQWEYGIVTDENFDRFKGDETLLFVPKIKITGTKANSMFEGCSQLMAVASIEVGDNVTSCEKMFSGCSSLVDAGSVKFSKDNKIASYASMFNSCLKLEHAPKIKVTSSCTTYNSIFAYCDKITDVSDITADWDVSNVSTPNGLDEQRSVLKYDTTGWDCSNGLVLIQYGKWLNKTSVVGSHTAQEVDEKGLTAFRNSQNRDWNLTGDKMYANILNQASLMALINGLPTLKQGESGSFMFYNVNTLGTYKDKYLKKLKEKGWTSNVTLPE